MIAQRAWWLGVVVLVGCTGQTQSTSLTVTEVDSAGVAIVTITGEVADLPEWHLAESPQFTVDGSEPPFLARVGQVALLSDGRVVVSDAQADQIHLFGVEGEHIRILGDQGDGPGEYQGVTAITVGVGDSVFVYDQRHGRLSVVHPEAGFMRDVSFIATGDAVKPRFVFSLNSGRMISYGATWADSDETRKLPYAIRGVGHLTLMGNGPSPLAVPESFLAGVTVIFKDGSISGAFTNAPVLATGRGNLVHGSGERYELTVRNSDFERLREIRWDVWDRPMNEPEIDSVRIEIRKLYKELDAAPQLAQLLEDALMAPNTFPEERPALKKVLMDDLGRIWVSEFRSRFLEASLEWHILDATGHPIGRITLPFGSRLVAVWGSQIALLVSDDLDVPSIQVWTIVN